jgi:hypothetical protein
MLEIRRIANRYAKWLLLVDLIAAYAAIFMLRSPNLIQISVWLFVAILLFSCVMLLQIYRVGTTPVPPLALWGGIAFLWGGAAFDMIATVIVNPDLSLEANIVARALLDAGYSVSFIYGYAIAVQALLQLMLSLMWASALHHRDTLLENTWQADHSSFKGFALASIGRIGYKGIFVFKPPKGYYDLIFFHTFFTLTFAAMGMGLYRWYLGFANLRILPYLPDLVIGVVCISIGIAVYIYWLRGEYQRRIALKPLESQPAHEQRADS